MRYQGCAVYILSNLNRSVLWTRAKKIALIRDANREWRDLWGEIVG